MNKKERQHYLFLQQSFEDFNQATLRMQIAFSSLEKKFENINRELEQKNTELQQVIAEKEEVRSYLQNILESLSSGVIVADLQGRITILNRCARLFLGVTGDKAIGRCIASFLPEMIGGNLDAGSAKASKSLTSGEKMRIKDRTIEFSILPLTGKANAAMGTIYILRDVTRIEKLEEMAKRTEKFEAMSELAANIAHEIRNPLGSIELFASLLMKENKQKKDQERLLQIISSVKNVDNKIANLLLFTRRLHPLMKRINLHKVLKEVLVFSRQIIEEGGIFLNVRYVEREPFVNGDPEMLKQVFLNILLNALQAMPDGGQLDIQTKIKEAGIEIRFADTGGGIVRENLSKIFNPFFSTKARSSGLGLAIVHTIIDIHEGAIDVESTDKGAVFSVTLPVAGKKARSATGQIAPVTRKINEEASIQYATR